MICSKCGQDSEGKFCSACGAPLTQPEQGMRLPQNSHNAPTQLLQSEYAYDTPYTNKMRFKTPIIIIVSVLLGVITGYWICSINSYDKHKYVDAFQQKTVLENEKNELLQKIQTLEEQLAQSVIKPNNEIGSESAVLDKHEIVFDDNNKMECQIISENGALSIAAICHFDGVNTDLEFLRINLVPIIMRTFDINDIIITIMDGNDMGVLLYENGELDLYSIIPEKYKNVDTRYGGLDVDKEHDFMLKEITTLMDKTK